MRRTTLLAATLVAATFAGADGASAQTWDRFALEGRVGLTVPTGDLSDAGYSTGLGVGLDAMYNFNPSLTAYAGISRHAFSCDEEDGPCDESAVAGGFQGGLKVLLVREARALPWIRGGVIGQSLDPDGDTSDLGIGFEIGGGVDIDVTHRFAVVPGVHYRNFTADFGEADVKAGWVAITLGGHLHF